MAAGGSYKLQKRLAEVGAETTAAWAVGVFCLRGRGCSTEAGGCRAAQPVPSAMAVVRPVLNGGGRSHRSGNGGNAQLCGFCGRGMAVHRSLLQRGHCPGVDSTAAGGRGLSCDVLRGPASSDSPVQRHVAGAWHTALVRLFADGQPRGRTHFDRQRHLLVERHL